jgi:hypothetical protein
MRFPPSALRAFGALLIGKSFDYAFALEKLSRLRFFLLRA